jgi:PilZ domain
MDESKDTDKRRVERDTLRTNVEFYVDADIIDAVSVDVSKIGVRFDTDEPINVRMRMEVAGRLIEREAELVWAVKDVENGRMTYGLEYVPETESTL